MKGSYKLALVLAVVVLAAAIIYHFSQPATQQPIETIGPVGQQSDAPVPRPTLADIPSRSEAPAPPTDPSASGPDLFSRVQAQIEASQNNATPDALSAATATPSPAAAPASPSDAAPTFNIDTHPGSSSPGSSSPGSSTGSLTAAGSPAPTPASAPASNPAIPPAAPGSSTPGISTPGISTLGSFSANTPAPSPAVPPAGVSGASAATYIIQIGDTFSSIAARQLGSERHWVAIAQANPLVDPAKLKVGQVIRLPSSTDVRTSRSSDASDVAGPTNEVTYIVHGGDTLSSIAQHYYGDSDQWRVIFNANRGTIGPNPDKLQAGDRLVIPPAPSRAR